MFTIWATFIATGAAVLASATAIFQSMMLRRQLKNEDRVRVATFYQGLTALFLNLDVLLLDRPHLRPYFYDNELPDDVSVRAQVDMLCEYVCDMAESCTAAEEVLPELKGDWDDFFNMMYRSSPALREYWGEFGHLFPDRVRRAIVGPSFRPKARPDPSPSIVDHLPAPAPAPAVEG